MRDDLNMKNSSTLSLARLYRAMLASVTSKSNNTVTFPTGRRMPASRFRSRESIQLENQHLMKTIPRLTLTVVSALFVIVAALFWTSASPKVTGQMSPTFLFAPQASTGLAPYEVELADMDGDGDLDFVTSNLVDQEFSTVSVSKNNGDGTFAAPVDYAVGPNPTDLRLADFNGDGRPDVVCLAALSGDDGGTSYVTVLFNNGTGGLINRHDYPVGENANSGGWMWATTMVTETSTLRSRPCWKASTFIAIPALARSRCGHTSQSLWVPPTSLQQTSLAMGKEIW